MAAIGRARVRLPRRGLRGAFLDAWTFAYGVDPNMAATIGAITGVSTTILLGRRTFEMFAPAWRDRTVEDEPGAPYFNNTEKFVVGTDVPVDEWANSVSLGPYDPEAVRRLKTVRQGVIYVSGSGQLVRALLAEGCTCSCTRSPSARGRSSGGRRRPDPAGPDHPRRLRQRGRASLLPTGGAARWVKAGRTLPGDSASAIIAEWPQMDLRGPATSPRGWSARRAPGVGCPSGHWRASPGFPSRPSPTSSPAVSSRR